MLIEKWHTFIVETSKRSEPPLMFQQNFAMWKEWKCHFSKHEPKDSLDMQNHSSKSNYRPGQMSQWP